MDRYQEDTKMMFVWVGAEVDIPYKVYRYLGTLGPKLYFLRLPKVEKTEDEYITQINSDFEERVKVIEKTLFEYLKWFEMYPEKIDYQKLTGTQVKMIWMLRGTSLGWPACWLILEV
jgi:hypothetical protein